jgi:V/A-type H+-transporting ATPase subunit F
MKIAVLGDEDTATLFQMVGAESYAAHKQYKDTFHDLVSRDDIAVLIVTEKIADSLIDEITAVKLQKDLPVIVVIPDKKGKIKGREDSIGRLIKRAVGVEIEK